MKTKGFFLSLIALFTVVAFFGCNNAAGPADTTAPIVVSNLPADGATNVSRISVISAKFSEDMDQDTMVEASFTVYDDAATPAIVTGTVSYDVLNMVARFTPAAILAYDTQYTATLTTDVADLAGNTMVMNHAWTFTTTDVVDTIPPTVLSTIPVDAYVGASLNGIISAVFSEAMDPATIVPANFTVLNGTIPVLGNVTYDIPNMTARFAPTEILQGETIYTATVSTMVADSNGNFMADNKVWTFTTAVDGSGPAPVILGTAGNFAILAKTAISTVPASAITGDIGVSPAAETYLTGFSQTKATGYSTSTQVTGFLYAADMTPPTPSMMTTAISDMETAYTDAAGRPTPNFTNLYSGEIGGRTLVAGLYKWGTSVTISSNLTISGGANDVWIFQVDNNLSIASGKQIILSGGALAKNIFWQVAGQTSLGTTSHFEGVILCKTAVDLKTGATINGKILAQTRVDLDQATVTDVQ